jgi:hypothetical protein
VVADPNTQTLHTFKPRRRWPWSVWVLASLIVVAGVAAGLAWLSRQPPAFWQQQRSWLAQQPLSSLEALAVNLEQRTLAALQMQSGQSDLIVGEHQANAWLRVRLWPWIEHFSPREAATWKTTFGDPVVTFDENRITLAFQSSAPDSPVMAADLVVERPRGTPMLRLTRVNMGRLPLLGGLRLFLSAASLDEDARLAVQSLLVGAPIDDALFEDAHWTGGRPVRLTDLRVHAGRLTALFEAQAR